MISPGEGVGDQGGAWGGREVKVDSVDAVLTFAMYLVLELSLENK